MDLEYVIFLDHQHKGTATSIKEVVSRIFNYLEAAERNYLESNRSSDDETVWISAEYDSKIVPVTKAVVKKRIRDWNEVEVYCESNKIGIYHVAAAIEVTMWKARQALAIQAQQRKQKSLPLIDPFIDDPNSDGKDTTIEDAIAHGQAILKKRNEENNSVELRQAVFTAEEVIKPLVSHDGKGLNVPEAVSVPNPFISLQAAENRIFAYHLRYCIDKTQLPWDYFDGVAKFAEGTCVALANAEIRPTRKMVDTLARVLRIKPEDLWVDLLPHFMKSTEFWRSYTDIPAEQGQS